MLLQHQTWQEVETYLAQSKGIILPIGSTEQHGPNGLIGTDAICAEVIAKAVGEAANAMVGPTIGVGIAVHHMGFAGSMTVKPSTLIAIIHDYVLSLARHGFRKFLFINGHGGNIATANAAFSEIYAATSLAGGGNAPTLRCKLANWWEAPGVRSLIRELFAGRDGAHATPSEISVTQFAHPEAIKSVGPIPPGPPSQAFADSAHYRRLFPDGHIASDPNLASPEHGAKLVAAAVQGLAEAYGAFLAAD